MLMILMYFHTKAAEMSTLSSPAVDGSSGQL
jgi:hypothetical protein